MLSYYDPELESGLFSDASPKGVQATLAQRQLGGHWYPVNMASRSLTTTEQSYDQIEREAVAMHFGCFRFRKYLEGCHFSHFIDPEPLKAMMDKTKREAPARIERIRLKLQGFSRDVKLIKGSENPADFHSRHPFSYKRCSRAERRDFADIQNHLFMVVSMLPEAVTVDRVRQETKDDPVLTEVMKLKQNGLQSLPTTAAPQLQAFKNIWQSLLIADGLLLRGERIVIPEKLTKV